MNSLENCNIEVQSKRLTLRTLKPSDYSDSYLRWLNDPQITQYLELRHGTHTQESIVTFIEEMLASPNNLQLGMFLQETGRHIGNIKIGPVNWRYKRADIGLIIGEQDCWGQGYASEAIEAVADIGLQTLGLRRVQAGAYGSNKGSIKAFLNAGFCEEGRLKSYWLLDGKPEDTILVGKTI